jgi:hypothetical protein
MPPPTTASAERPLLPIGTPRHFRWLEGIVKVTLVLNLLDAIFTLTWVVSGLASEANPFLHELAHRHPVGFVSAKLALVGLASLLLWRLRSRPLAVVGIFAAFLLYYAVLLIHVDYLALVLGILFFG